MPRPRGLASVGVPFYHRTMFEGWGEFFLMVGSAAAVLIGLIFVVVSLMDDRPRETVLTGSQLYMGPIVLNMSFVLVLSAAALVPKIAGRTFAVIVAVCAAWGVVRAVMSWVGITRLATGSHVHWTDRWFYGAVPAALYLALGWVAWSFWSGSDWSDRGIALVLTALLLSGIRNEWDLVTWLAPKTDRPDDFG